MGGAAFGGAALRCSPPLCGAELSIILLFVAFSLPPLGGVAFSLSHVGGAAFRSSFFLRGAAFLCLLGVVGAVLPMKLNNIVFPVRRMKEPQATREKASCRCRA